MTKLYAKVPLYAFVLECIGFVMVTPGGHTNLAFSF